MLIDYFTSWNMAPLMAAVALPASVWGMTPGRLALNA